MKQTENNTISFDLKDNKTNIIIITILKYIGGLSTYIVKLSLFFLFLSIFIFNLQVQTYHFDKDNKQIVTQYNDIVQCEDNPIEILKLYLTD